MGWLFGSSSEDEEVVEKKLQNIFAEHIQVYGLALSIYQESESQPWITQCQGYYDSRRRTVFFDEDLVGVMWYSEKMVKTNDGTSRAERDVHGKKAYSHTKSGYVPLHKYFDKSTGVTISKSQIIKLFAAAVKAEMQKRMPECKFSDIQLIDGMTAFTYTVPALEWNDWF